ncbi:hypothetical protein A8A54_04405 [Brucella pseudogrignonensis]|uniref:hypothetical protein n=1 Tax=Brucella pseudogrignonensis TaxID=419475 RepID=UPI0007DA57E7|nr:hypothetical protein [Brucella pseudogrignonensis]ANG95793.1 hypothetical protein A8A54_04405 [Brucella pseudogrignonensis]
MNKVHLHYTYFPERQFLSVAAFGLTPEQIQHYALGAGFFFICAPKNTIRFLTYKDNSKAKIKLGLSLMIAGYDVSVSSASYDMLPPTPSTLPIDSPLRERLGDEAWYCGVGGAA